MNAAVLVLAAALNLTPGNFDVVIPPKSQGGILFAMEELTNYLGRAFGQPISVKKQLDPARPSIVLGTNAWSEAAGVDLLPLRRDGYLLKTKGNALYIAGLDDKVYLNYARTNHGYRHGTLNGVYAFLEDFVGCRFYFPHELGEIVPHCDAIKVPELDRHDNPAMDERRVSYWDGGEWFDEKDPQKNRKKALSPMRLRLSTGKYIDCHGLRYFHYVPRFKETHPEYFQLKKDGTRNLYDSGHAPHALNGKLCFTSGIREEIYQDVKAYLTERPASSRGLKNWGTPGKRACWGGLYVGLHPEDGYEPCQCTNCQAAYRKGDPSYASELIWGLTKEISERLEKEGIKAMLLQSAYSAWSRIPDIDLPKNILIDVATTGPWATGQEKNFQKDLEKLRVWSEKLGHPVLTWTYPGKYSMSGRNPDVPQVTPHAYVKYLKAAAKYIAGPNAGMFAESTSDRWMFNMLNRYVFSRLTWNPEADADAILDEHYRLMYGAAAPQMKEFFEILEDTWMNRIQGNFVDTAIGPVAIMPSEFRIWTDIYSPARLAELAKIFEKAAAAVPAGSLEARRIALMKGEFLDRMMKHSTDMADGFSVEKEKARRAANPPVSVVSGFKPTTITVEPSPTNKPFKAYKLAVDLKPGKSYRISFFAKGENVAAWAKRGGVQGVIWFNEDDDDGVCIPKNGIDGTFDWIHFSHVVRLSQKVASNFRPEIDLRLFFATGTVHFDGLVVEELKENK